MNQPHPAPDNTTDKLPQLDVHQLDFAAQPRFAFVFTNIVPHGMGIPVYVDSQWIDYRAKLITEPTLVTGSDQADAYHARPGDMLCQPLNGGEIFILPRQQANRLYRLDDQGRILCHLRESLDQQNMALARLPANHPHHIDLAARQQMAQNDPTLKPNLGQRIAAWFGL